jgi:hypothetical protein
VISSPQRREERKGFLNKKYAGFSPRTLRLCGMKLNHATFPGQSKEKMHDVEADVAGSDGDGNGIGLYVGSVRL